MSRSRLFVLLLFLSLPSPSAQAAEKAPRTDRHGDPLPEGALARLGSGRLRVEEGVKALAFWPDDQTLAACCEDGSLRLWDRATGRPKLWRDTGLGAVEFAAFVPGSSRVLLFGGEKCQFLLWDTVVAKTVWKQAWRRGGEIRSLAVSPDGKLFAVASCCADEAYVYEISSGRKLRTLTTRGWPTITLAFSPDSGLLAVTGMEKKSSVRLWDVRTGEKVRDLAGPSERVCALAFAADGKTLAAASDGRAVLFDVATGKPRITLGFERDSVSYDLTDDAIRLSADGKTLFSGHYPPAVRFWDCATGKERLFRKAPPSQWTRLALSRDGKALATADGDGLYPLLHLLSPATGKDLLPLPEGHHSKVHFVAFTPNGRTILSGDRDTVWRWDAGTGKPERSLLELELGSSTLSSDRRHLAEVWAGEVRLWDLAAGKKLRELTYAGKDVIRAAAFSPDGNRLLSLHSHCLEEKGPTREGRHGLHVWDLATGKETESFPAPVPDKELYAGLVLTPDGSTAIAGSIKGWVNRDSSKLEIHTEDKGAGRLYRWNMRIGLPLRPLDGHEGAIRSLSLSADGKQLVSASADHTCRLWELASGQTVFRLPAPKSAEQTAALSPDGRLLASSSGREESPTADPFAIRVYSAVTGRLILVLHGHDSCLHCLEFSPDGCRLASGFRDGTALVWDVSAAQQAVRDEVRQLAAKQAEPLWADLAAAEAVKARQAVWSLSGQGNTAVRLLGQRLQPAEGMTAEHLHKLVADLDDDAYAIREAASRKLSLLGELAEPALVAVLKGQPSPEQRRRARRLLARLSTTDLAPPQLRAVRAIEVLERISSPEARQLLRRLAAGAADARLTREARAALDRLGQHTAP